VGGSKDRFDASGLKLRHASIILRSELSGRAPVGWDASGFITL
jgi:hypothetical protein